MNHDQQLKIQAYLDGELSSREAKEVSELIARDSDARLLYGELQMTRTAVVGNELEVKLPESREFFWSKIERDIRAQQPVESVERTPSLSFVGWLQRYLVPIGAAAAVAFIAVVATNRSNTFEAASTETLNEDMGSITFRSESEGMTVVYLYDRSTE